MLLCTKSRKQRRVMSDGRESPPLELRGPFEQFLHETR
jgi:hypothetical protein